MDIGEAEAITLASETGADLLLIDELLGRSVADRLGIVYTGTLGTLTLAKKKRIIPEIKPFLDNLAEVSGFWIGNKLYAEVLKQNGEK